MSENWKDRLSTVTARAWNDDAYRTRLKNEPTAVLKEAGVDVPEHLEVRVVEDSDTVAHMVIPPKPEQVRDAKMGGDGGHADICCFVHADICCI